MRIRDGREQEVNLDRENRTHCAQLGNGQHHLLELHQSEVVAVHGVQQQASIGSQQLVERANQLVVLVVERADDGWCVAVKGLLRWLRRTRPFLVTFTRQRNHCNSCSAAPCVLAYIAKAVRDGFGDLVDEHFPVTEGAGVSGGL